MTAYALSGALPEEPRWHAALAAVAAVMLYITLPPRIIVGPLWLLPLLVLGILIPLLIFSPHRHRESEWARLASIAHIAVLTIFNVATVALFIYQLLHGKHLFSGEQLLLAAIEVWVTNILVYSLWFWEIDGGGPAARLSQELRRQPAARRLHVLAEFAGPGGARAIDVAASVHRLPISRIYKCHGIQSDRHVPADPARQDADDGGGLDGPRDDRDRGRPRGEYGRRLVLEADVVERAINMRVRIGVDGDVAAERVVELRD